MGGERRDLQSSGESFWRRTVFLSCVSGVIYRKNGKDNGNYRDYRGYIGITEKKLVVFLVGFERV